MFWESLAHQWAADYFLVRMVVPGTKPVENPWSIHTARVTPLNLSALCSFTQRKPGDVGEVLQFIHLAQTILRDSLAQQHGTPYSMLI